MFRWLFGPSRNQSNEYLNPGRLEDVIALIQVLGLDEYTSRSENALKTVLCGTPHSMGTSASGSNLQRNILNFSGFTMEEMVHPSRSSHATSRVPTKTARFSLTNTFTD